MSKTGFLTVVTAPHLFEKGCILTCDHVVEDIGGKNNVIKVEGVFAELIESDTTEGFDIAILKTCERLHVPPLKLKAICHPGDEVITIGCHKAKKKTIREKIEGILRKRVDLRSGKFNDYCTAWYFDVQNNESLRKGYSGAPLVDENSGKVLGIVSQDEDEGKEGFAVSIDALEKVWQHMPEDMGLEAFNYDRPKVARNRILSSIEDFRKISKSLEDRSTIEYYLQDLREDVKRIREKLENEIRENLENEILNVLFLGHYEIEKNEIINALLGEEILIQNISPRGGILEVVSGEKPEVIIFHNDGHYERKDAFEFREDTEIVKHAQRIQVRHPLKSLRAIQRKKKPKLKEEKGEFQQTTFRDPANGGYFVLKGS
ncbi:MAG: trypsin-like peptidase domain-containing protein [Spirulina sp. SIO3F2]|nr:trypsin-like peptidase domain-containing protein [Spirulina sp. SIO3F2]